MNTRIKHNQVIVHVLNEDQTDYTQVLVSLHSPYVEYNLGTPAAKKAASNLIVHQPDFLDRHYAPLWCSFDGKYVKTQNVPQETFRKYTRR